MRFLRPVTINKKTTLLFSVICLVGFIMLFKNHKSRIKSKHKNPLSHVNAKLERVLKQFSRAYRLERNHNLRSKMNTVVERLDHFIKASNILDSTTESNHLLEDLTAFIDASNTIKDGSSLRLFLTQLIKQLESNKDYASMLSVVLVIDTNARDSANEALIRRVETLTHDFKVRIQTQSLHLVALLLQVATKYVLVCASSCVFSLRDLPMLLGRLNEGVSDVVGVTTFNALGEWRIGCFQSKLLWYQYNLQAGYDHTINNNDFTQCDHLSGPLMTTKENIISSLYNKDRYSQGGGKSATTFESFLSDNLGDHYTLHSSSLLPHLSNLHLFYDMLMAKKLVHICIRCDPIRLFGGNDHANVNDRRKSDDLHWIDFAKKTKISDFNYTPDAAGGGDATAKSSLIIRYTCNEIDSVCHMRRRGFMSERCCIRDLHDALITTFQLFDKHKLEYTLSDGSALGAIKMKWTLPWDLDQDYEFRSENLTALLTHKKEFAKHGLTLVPKLNSNCIENPTKNFVCGYMAIRNQYWRLESWGQRLLTSDFYERWKIPKENSHTMPSSRIQDIPTQVRMGDYWTYNQPNPGRFTRGHFGTDALKHVQHRQDGGPEDFKVDISKLYFPAKCPLGEFHGCIDNFISDGNLIFEKNWV